jgi:hypothetical protein
MGVGVMKGGPKAMERLDRQLPRAAIVETALRQTTERLAAELASPVDRAPDWNEFEWRAAMAVSVMHGISALLAGRLRWAGPPHWQAFLAEQAEQGLLREHKTRALLARLHEAAARADLPLLAMKGSALLDLGLYAPGQRPMSDVDLLVRPEDFDAAHRLLLQTGYAEGLTTTKHTDYVPLDAPAAPAFGEHAANAIKIELHTAVKESLPVRVVDITARLLPSTARPGVNAYPGAAALMRHLLIHAAGNLCVHGIRLIHLHDLAALAGRLSASDWDEALAPASDGLPAWWAVPPLELAMRLFPDRWPRAAMAPALSAARAACPVLLRRATRRHRLDNMSMSGFRIPLLPGVTWSHNAAEALECARIRLYPGREALRLGRRATLALHAFASSAGTDKPRWQKALRYLLGAPPRVTTLYSLQRALAYEPAHTSSP